MKKIVVAALILVCLAAIGLTGCSKKSSGSAGDGRQTASDPNLNLTGLPIVKEQASFTILVDGDGSPDEKYWIPILEKNTNVRINWQNFPYQTAVERKNILVSTGDYPDVLAGWVLTQNDVMSYAAEGMILPLEDLIEKYAPNIKEALNIPGVRRDMTLPDGHIYSPPYVVGEPTVSFSPWINEEWLKQVNMPMPTTTAELKAVLIAFRDKIPAVRGQKIIPFSGDPVNLSLGTYAGWFGVNACNTGSNPGLAMINGQLESTFNRDEYRDALKYFADLYANNLIDPELFTQDQSTWKAKGLQGLYGVSVAYGAGDFAPKLIDSPSDLTVRNSNYEVLPVLKGPGVTKPVFRRNGFGVTLFQNQLVITDKAKDVITIIRWIDNLYDSDQSYTLNAGPAGIAVEKVDNNTYRALDKSGLSSADQSKYEWGNLFFQSMPRFTRTSLVELPASGQGKAYKEIDVRDALYEPYLEAETVPLFWLTQADARRVADIQQAIVAYVNQKQAEWVSGQASIDAEWDAYVAQLDRLGLPELLKIKRAAIGK